MPREIELKLEIPATKLKAVPDAAWVKKLAQGEPKRQVRKGKRDKATVRRIYGLGFVTGRERASVPDCIAAAAKAGKRVRHHSGYWR